VKLLTTERLALTPRTHSSTTSLSHWVQCSTDVSKRSPSRGRYCQRKRRLGRHVACIRGDKLPGQVLPCCTIIFIPVTAQFRERLLWGHRIKDVHKNIKCKKTESMNVVQPVFESPCGYESQHREWTTCAVTRNGCTKEDGNLGSDSHVARTRGGTRNNCEYHGRELTCCEPNSVTEDNWDPRNYGTPSDKPRNLFNILRKRKHRLKKAKYGLKSTQVSTRFLFIVKPLTTITHFKPKYWGNVSQARNW
jgi:hypothetical protein